MNAADGRKYVSVMTRKTWYVVGIDAIVRREAWMVAMVAASREAGTLSTTSACATPNNGGLPRQITVGVSFCM